MSFVKFIFVFYVFFMRVNVCLTAFRTLQVEQIFSNQVMLENLRAEQSPSSSSLCSALCRQEECECFGFNSVTETCRVHAFCKTDNTFVEVPGWNYYRSRAGWKSFLNSEYLVGLEGVTWNEAQMSCMIQGAKLVEVGSSEEDSYIRTVAASMTTSVWLGGTDLQTEGEWKWQSTNDLFSYSAWDRANGQPNNYNNQDCLCLYRPYSLTWCDEGCGGRYQYICERELFTGW